MPAALCFALALSAGTADRAFAQPPTLAGVYEIVARHSGKCLDVMTASLSDGAAVIQWACHGAANQQWRLEPFPDGSYRIVATHSGKSLDVNFASQGDGVQLIQWPPHNADNQKWILEPTTAGHYRFRARHSGKLMDISGASPSDGAAAIQWPGNGGANQEWLLRSTSTPPSAPATADIVRFLEQATFGPTPALIEHVRSIGFEAFLDEQFNAPMSSYPTMPLYPSTRDEAACPSGSICQRDNYTLYPLQNRFFINALYGEDQLRQRVAFALHQLIVVSGVEITLPSWMAPYLQTLDRNAFGSYRQLLYEITLNPAMGNYLDVNGNTRTRPNENYAREVLQLFSLGTLVLNPDGTPQRDEVGEPIPSYTQETVDNFARVFTGWRFATAPATGVPNYIDPMVANEPQHDTALKTLLNGMTLLAGGTTARDLNDAIDNIMSHQNVAPFISKHLIQHLVTSNPSPEYVGRVSAAFGFSGDLRAVVRAILLDPEARGESKSDAAYGRLRHPIQFITGMLRAFGARSADGTGLSDGYLNPQTVTMGMDVFRPPSVFSYFSPTAGVPGGGGLRGPEFGIFSTSTAVRRINLANTMVFSRIAVSASAPLGTSIDFTPLLPLAANPAELVRTLDERLLHGTMSPEMRTSIQTAVTAVAASNALKRVRTAAYLILTSAHYQVER